MLETIDATEVVLEKTEFNQIGYLQIVKHESHGELLYILQFKATVLPFFCDECNTDMEARCRCVERVFISNYLSNKNMLFSEKREIVFAIYQKMKENLDIIKTLTRRHLCEWIETNFSSIPVEDRQYEYGFYIHKKTGYSLEKEKID